MLAMSVNDNAGCLTTRGDLTYIASKLGQTCSGLAFLSRFFLD